MCCLFVLLQSRPHPTTNRGHQNMKRDHVIQQNQATALVKSKVELGSRGGRNLFLDQISKTRFLHQSLICPNQEMTNDFCEVSECHRLAQI